MILVSIKENPGYFAIKRFDRNGDKRYHMHSACGLLHSDFRTPSLDYQELLTLSNILTRDMREVEKMYQLAVFNVLAHNRDDHSKNFSYLMNSTGQWKLAPAYDLTFSSGLGGEQSTMVMGEGHNPNIEHLLQLAKKRKIKNKRALQIIEATKSSLAKWPILAKQYGVCDMNMKLIDNKINT